MKLGPAVGGRLREREGRPSEHVILVDERDVARGVAEKMAAHRLGLRHRAFSIFLFDDAGRLLLQRRAADKYHSPGLWTNTCCGHPRPGEDVTEAARRRLGEEMGIATDLTRVLRFEYRTHLAGGLTEHEIDHVLIGRWAGTPRPDPDEASDWRWQAPRSALHDARLFPELYTAWFEPALARLLGRDPAPLAPR